MAVPFRAVHATFWTGKTGKLIRVGGPTTQVLALYAITSPHSNMIGLYRLPIQYVAADTGLSEKTILATFAALEGVGFLRYDPDTEWIWVCAMSKWQLGNIKSGDKRLAGARAMYQESGECPFLAEFYALYGATYDLPSPPEAPSKPLPSPMDKETVQDTDSTETGTETVQGAPSALDERFARFWAAYPKRIGKAAALKAWRKIRPSEVLTETILTAIEAQKHGAAWTKDGGQYIPNPATWLNQGRWDDDVQAASAVTAARSSQRTSGNMAALQTVLERSKGAEAIDGLFTQKRLCAGDGSTR